MARYKSSADPKALAVALIVMGLIMVVVTISSAIQVSEFKKIQKRCTESTEGVVVNVTKEMHTRRRNKHTRIYYLYVTEYLYEAGGNEWYSTSKLSESEALVEGDTITVYFDPNEPDICYTGYDGGNNPIVAVITAAVLSIVFIAAGISMRRRIALGGTGFGYGGLDGAAMDRLDGVNRGNVTGNNADSIFNNNANFGGRNYNNNLSNGTNLNSLFGNGSNNNSFNNGSNYNNNFNNGSNYNNNFNNGSNYNNNFNNGTNYNNNFNNNNDIFNR